MRNALFLVAALSLMLSGCTGGSSEVTRPDTADIDATPIDMPDTPGGGVKSIGAAPE